MTLVVVIVTARAIQIAALIKHVSHHSPVIKPVVRVSANQSTILSVALQCLLSDCSLEGSSETTDLLLMVVANAMIGP